ncbi:2'-5' RNA ligase family protein [Legionella sp. W05-934-2]|uniref:2'-5' RNA ligase family protein n=1 Tax=Legionella sp. W05-934-2 TaxID=1198649 RepID=UPI003461DD20
MKWLICVLFSIFCQFCQALPLNIYVSYEDNVLKEYIHHFTDYLKSNGIFEKYHIEPFIDRFPLHTTLYLADFESNHIADVTKIMTRVTANWHPFTIATAKIYITEGNYVMLDVDYQIQSNGLNPIIQNYSDEMVLAVHDLRNQNAPIPDWAKNYPSKQRAYQRYGSPNVFFELSPHFTLMAKKFKDSKTAQAFHDDVALLIQQYEQNNLETPIHLTAAHIGLGYVNEYGQITKEIERFGFGK